MLRETAKTINQTEALIDRLERFLLDRQNKGIKKGNRTILKAIQGLHSAADMLEEEDKGRINT